MTSPFPHRYGTELRWVSGRLAVLSSPQAPPIDGGPPPEFDGPAGRWSPEALLLSAAELCLMTTFLAVAEHAGLAVADYQSRSEGVLDRTVDGPAFTRVVLRVRLSVYADDAEKARTLMEKAKKRCIVSRTLRIPPELEVEVVPA
ncbi:MAG: OsmC family protein [Elusimicrobia bacterium]|nr:OsmC family protein [Elusimicrobiota bacterium]